MKETDEDRQDQNEPNLLESVLNNTSCLRWLLLPVALAFALVLGSVILLPTKILPDYVVFPIVFALGMIGWGFLVGRPTKDTRRLWLYSAMIWASSISLLYSASDWQHNHILNGWYWIGMSLLIAPFILGGIFHLADKSKKRDH